MSGTDVDVATMTAAEMVEAAPVMVFSKSYCPYCRRAKSILDEAGAAYEVVELDQEANGGRLQQQMGQLAGRTSVPAVFVGGQYIGGCSDGGLGGVATLAANGSLQQLLEDAGAL